MKPLLILASLSLLVSCGARRPGGNDGVNGTKGLDGLSSGIEMQDSGGVCYNGGVILSTFNDSNRNGHLDINESIYNVKTLCNGINGTNGVNGVNSSVSLESLPSGAVCPSGGVLISSNTGSTKVICNGVNGLNGANGIQGTQGIPGIQGPMGPQGPAGINGSTVVPVKFCSHSTSSFPEYGIKVGNDVFAVYWTGSQAFLSKLIHGSYSTTTGKQDCNFTI